MVDEHLPKVLSHNVLIAIFLSHLLSLFWHEWRRCSQSLFIWLTGNDIIGPLFSPFFCQTPVLGLGLGVDFTFAGDNHNNHNHKNHNHNNHKNDDNPHLNFVKGTVIG